MDRWTGKETMMASITSGKGPGGNTDNYTGAKFKIYTSLIVRSYHLENPLCITTQPEKCENNKYNTLHNDITVISYH